jgi:putative Mg2+ transporter-C (MgtC) family protein
MSAVEHLELALRLLAGAVLGAVIGYERDKRHRPAGLRTHAIVGLASSTFMVVSTHFFFFQGYRGQLVDAADPSKIASAVVAGIGFLAGGAILRHGLSVQGMTTAAGLWLVAALGLAVGAGMYVEGLVATVLGELVIVAVRNLERRSVRRRVSLSFDRQGPPVDEVMAHLRSLGVEVERREDDRDASGRRRAVLELTAAEAPLMEKARGLLEALPGLTRLRFEG